MCNTVFKVEKHFQKSFQALCFQITYFIYDLDNYQEFAKTGAVILYDLLFYLNENLEYVESEFQMDNNLHYARQWQMRGLLIVFSFDVVVTRRLPRDCRQKTI